MAQEGIPKEKTASNEKAFAQERAPDKGGSFAAIREQARAITLAPSMVDRYFNYIFGSYTGDRIPDIYKRYIEPLKNDVAKEVLKILLLDGEAHPELLREIGGAEVKDNFVRIANGIAVELEQTKSLPSPEAIIPLLQREWNQMLENARENARMKKLVEIQNGRKPFSDGSKTLESRAPLFSEDADIEKDAVKLNYFPGMPLFTHRIRITGRGNLTLVEKKETSQRVTVDEKVYDVYFGQKNIGRFTIRRHGNMVERNLFLTYPDGEIVSMGNGGSVFEDNIRQAKEWSKVIADKIKGLSQR